MNTEGIDPVRFDVVREAVKAEWAASGTYEDTLEVQRAISEEARERCLKEKE